MCLVPSMDEIWLLDGAISLPLVEPVTHHQAAPGQTPSVQFRVLLNRTEYSTVGTYIVRINTLGTV